MGYHVGKLTEMIEEFEVCETIFTLESVTNWNLIK